MQELKVAYERYMASKTAAGAVKAEAVLDFHDAMLRCQQRLTEEHDKTVRQLRLVLRPEKCRDVDAAVDRRRRLTARRDMLVRDAECWNAVLRQFRTSPAFRDVMDLAASAEETEQEVLLECSSMDDLLRELRS